MSAIILQLLSTAAKLWARYCSVGGIDRSTMLARAEEILLDAESDYDNWEFDKKRIREEHGQ